MMPLDSFSSCCEKREHQNRRAVTHKALLARKIYVGKNSSNQGGRRKQVNDFFLALLFVWLSLVNVMRHVPHTKHYYGLSWHGSSVAHVRASTFRNEGEVIDDDEFKMTKFSLNLVITSLFSLEDACRRFPLFLFACFLLERITTS